MKKTSTENQEFLLKKNEVTQIKNLRRNQAIIQTQIKTPKT